jgi:DNA polymerase III delta prime subunit
MFERGELLADVLRAQSGPPLLVTGPPGSGKTTLLHGAVEALAAQGWQPVYLDLLAAATSPERFVQAALGALPDGLEARAAARAREADQLARSGGKDGGRAVQALLSAWAALDTAAGRPVALVLDEATEIRSLAYFSGLRDVDAPFAAALSARSRGTLLATSFPGVARKLWPAMATFAMPTLSAAELQGEARRRGLRADGSALAAASFGWPRYARILVERLERGVALATAWAEEMTLGGRLEEACRHTYEVLLLRSRGYGMSKAVLAAVAAEEGLNLTALVGRLGRTPARSATTWDGCSRWTPSVPRASATTTSTACCAVGPPARARRPGDGGGDPRLCPRAPGHGRPRARFGAGGGGIAASGIDGDRLAMIFQSPRPPVEIPRVPVTDFILEKAAEIADRTALIDGITDRRVTYAGLAATIGRAAAGLAARGYGRGDVFGIYSPNTLEYPIAFHGAARLGAVVTTVNPLFTADEIGKQLRDCSAKCLFTIPAFMEKAQAAAAQAGVREIIVFGEAEGALSLSELIRASGPAPTAALGPDDVVALPYSSGTTGLPKGVMLTHGNIVANLVQSAAAMPVQGGDVVIAVLPFFHIYGLQVILNGGLRAGPP